MDFLPYSYLPIFKVLTTDPLSIFSEKVNEASSKNIFLHESLLLEMDTH